MFTTVLLIEDALTAHDVERMVGLHGTEPVTFYVVTSADDDLSSFAEAVDDIAKTHWRDAMHEEDADKSADELFSAAELRLASSVQALRAAGVAGVDGEVVPRNPVDATAETATRLDADEIVVLTQPHVMQGFLRRDWATRLRHAVHLPVLHVIAGTDEVMN